MPAMAQVPQVTWYVQVGFCMSSRNRFVIQSRGYLCASVTMTLTLKARGSRRLPKGAKVSFMLSSVKSSGMRNTNKLAPGGPCIDHGQNEQAPPLLKEQGPNFRRLKTAISSYPMLDPAMVGAMGHQGQWWRYLKASELKVDCIHRGYPWVNRLCLLNGKQNKDLLIDDNVTTKERHVTIPRWTGETIHVKD